MIAEERDRLDRLERLREEGIDPYPARVGRTHSLSEFDAAFDGLEKKGEEVRVLGRVRAVRKHGALTFLKIEDGSGEGQLMVRRDEIGDSSYDLLSDTIDVGDFVASCGTAIVTKTGAKSVLSKSVDIIVKATLPLPEKWHGLSDVETRFRHRSLDLISNPEVRERFRVRSAVTTAIRKFFDGHGYMEVETPILQHVAAGANAAPFVTRHNALDQDMYLRIAPELHLKRLVIGGYERVYEMARCFRNEGIDYSHNPEFTQVEAYAAYMDYEELMDLMEELMRVVVEAAGLDPAKVPYGEDVLDFSKKLERVTYRDIVLRESGIDIDTISDKAEALKIAHEHNVDVDESDSLTTIIDMIWKKLVRPKIIQPTFVIDYPAVMTPLAKKKPDNPERVEMFQMVLGRGFELMKAFTELNDPVDQEERLDEQEAAHQAGDEEAQRTDKDFIFAMKHGMPPMAGVGMGIDRLLQILTNSHSIKEVILFPTLRSKNDLDK